MPSSFDRSLEANSRPSIEATTAIIDKLTRWRSRSWNQRRRQLWASFLAPVAQSNRELLVVHWPWLTISYHGHAAGAASVPRSGNAMAVAVGFGGGGRFSGVPELGFCPYDGTAPAKKEMKHQCRIKIGAPTQICSISNTNHPAPHHVQLHSGIHRAYVQQHHPSSGQNHDLPSAQKNSSTIHVHH
ncbi:hypothetical protein Nepgr_000909 [Nepenthes gracilis]|uniref:Uncharacterized protein n=1 Tax=Nepenthes gracilis TaxID=150966 RepID=A0AAD3P268_NEPGR|nr:hypothetical protein Nepgr_000909 [Nepenthes gracilis]